MAKVIFYSVFLIISGSTFAWSHNGKSLHLFDPAEDTMVEVPDSEYQARWALQLNTRPSISHKCLKANQLHKNQSWSFVKCGFCVTSKVARSKNALFYRV